MTSTTQPPNAASLFNFNALKESLKKHGKIGVYTYLGLSTSVTIGIYFLLQNNVDVPKMLGMTEKDKHKEPSFLEKLLIGGGSTAAMAIVCSKMLVPIKVPVALALTPYVSRLVSKLKHR